MLNLFNIPDNKTSLHEFMIYPKQNISTFMRTLTSFLFSTLIIFFLMHIPFTASSQEIPIGQWRDHLPYSACVSVVKAGEKVYAATPYSLFYYDTQDNSLNRLGKIEGLSDVGIQTMEYDQETHSVVVAYTNANIDLITPDGIINISDIKRKPILGNKAINNIFIKDKTAYLACGFGIVLIDLEKQEIKDTYYIGPEGTFINVYDITYHNLTKTLYAATEKGVYFADFNSTNLASFEAWAKDLTIPNSNGLFNFIETFNDAVIINYTQNEWNKDSIYIKTPNNNWRLFNETYSNRRDLTVTNGHLLLVNPYNVSVYKDLNEQYANLYSINGQSLYPHSALALDDEAENIWIADNQRGIIRYSMKYSDAQIFRPNGPSSHKVFSMKSTGTHVWAVAGGFNLSFVPLYAQSKIYHLNNSEWNSFDKNNIDELNNTADCVDIAIDPTNPAHAFIASWGYGIFEFDNDKLINHYTDENSGLSTTIYNSSVQVGGVTLDRNNTLWCTNAKALEVLVSRDRDGQWKSYNFGGTNTILDLSKITIDKNNRKWILTRDTKLLVFDESRPVGNQVRTLTTSTGNGGLTGSKFFCITEDLDGEIWVGSNQGINIFYNPSNIYDNSGYDAQRVLVELDGIAQYLLDSETVSSIAVDGANRKWVGTESSGAYLISPDGTEQIIHFTEDNSPLLSNNIIDITIDDDGEVYFATEKGIISYKSTATPSNPKHENVLAYPNPVPPGYTGNIAVKGLVRDAYVKITNVSGSVLFSSKAEGGQIVWDGYTHDGEKAPTGVYLVFSTNEEGNETMVTKILIVN